MTKTWTVKDIIDLEFFLHGGESTDAGASKGEDGLEDRKVFLEEIQPRLPTETLTPSTYRRMTLRLWLEKQRERERAASGVNAVLPGEVFSDFYRFSLCLFVATGFIMGGGLALGFLSYTGTAPLNISIYLGIFVLTQIALISAFILLFLFRGKAYLFRNVGPMYALIGSIIVRTITRIKRRVFEKLSAGERSRIEAALGLISGTRKLYGALFYFVIFLLIQMFGVGFNLGVLSGTFARVLSSDLAFGWQSTIQVSARTVYLLVKAIALPWSWLVPQGIAYPSLAQVEGSKMVLKDGIYHLATMDLVAWWPFLCFCVLFYGLLPRLILLGAGWIGQTISLRRIEFSHAACDRLIRRFQTPVVQTGGEPSAGREGAAVLENSSAAAAETSPSASGLPEESAVILIHDDIFDQIPEDKLAQQIKNTLGFRLVEKIRIGIDPEKDIETVLSLSAPPKGHAPFQVVLLQEAWQPPIKEGLSFLRDVRKIFGMERRIYILLVGKPQRGGGEAPVTSQEKEIWQQAVKKLADPYLQVETSGGANGER